MTSGDTLPSTDILPSIDRLMNRANDAVARAVRAGADAAEVSVRAHSSTSVNVRLGKLEDVDHSEGGDLSLRLFIGQRVASLSTADASPAALDILVDRAIAMARISPENPWAGLAPSALLASGALPDLDLFDHGATVTPEKLRDMAHAAEDAARAVAGVTNSEGGAAAASQSAHAVVTSQGFAGGTKGSGYSVSASVIAGTGSDMQRDYDWHNVRHLGDLEPAPMIGNRAGERAVARLNPGSMPSGPLPVLFDPRVAASLIGHAISAMMGPLIAKGYSFLADHEGAKIFCDEITLLDDPHRMRGLRSRAVDGEGLPTQASALIDRGVIAPWLCDVASARQLGRQPTGHASGSGGVTTGNLSIAAGACDRATLMADIKQGVLVTELLGQGVDLLTGDYSRGASGWRIVDGEIAGPVTGFTIAGNLLAIFAGLRAANDVDRRYSTHVPTLRTDAMTVAGD